MIYGDSMVMHGFKLQVSGTVTDIYNKQSAGSKRQVGAGRDKLISSLNKPAAQAVGADPPPLKLHQ